MRSAATIALAASALGGCALAPGEQGVPIIPIVMIPAGIILLVWGLTQIPSRSGNDDEKDGDGA